MEAFRTATCTQVCMKSDFTVPSFEATKDAFDNPVIDGTGNVVYKVFGCRKPGHH